MVAYVSMNLLFSLVISIAIPSCHLCAGFVPRAGIRSVSLNQRNTPSPFIRRISKVQAKQESEDDSIPWVKSLVTNWPQLWKKIDETENSLSDSDFEEDDDDTLCVTLYDEEEQDENAWPFLPWNDGGIVSPPPSSWSLLNLEALLNLEENESLLFDDGKNTSYNGLNETASDATRDIPSSDWQSLVRFLQSRISEMIPQQQLQSAEPKTKPSTPTEEQKFALDNTTLKKVETFLYEASSAFNPFTFLDSLARVNNSTTAQVAQLQKSISDTLLTSEQRKSTDTLLVQAKATADYTTEILNFANKVLTQGWSGGEDSLFSGYRVENVLRKDDSNEFLRSASRFATLSECVYHPERWGSVVQGDGPDALHHSIVKNGTVVDVQFLITDSVSNGELVRTITFKGYDATDASIDRERLLQTVVSAAPETLVFQQTSDSGEEGGAKEVRLEAHSGLMTIARELYGELMSGYVDTLGSGHKLVLNGHSIGGSLSILFMVLMIQDRGVEFVKNKIQNVYTFGSPPVLMLPPSTPTTPTSHCPILSLLQIPPTLIQSYIQPWDPIIRLFTPDDPLYPLIDDIGPDGVTPLVSGPPRTLRPILRTLLENWNSWPRFRETLQEQYKGDYVPVGSFYMLLPDTVRYLTDRLVSVNINVPPVQLVMEMKDMGGKRLLRMLKEVFPLEVFQISLVPVALRSFIHHFYPAYSIALVDYIKNQNTKVDYQQEQQLTEKIGEYLDWQANSIGKAVNATAMEQKSARDAISAALKGFDWAGGVWNPGGMETELGGGKGDDKAGSAKSSSQIASFRTRRDNILFPVFAIGSVVGNLVSGAIGMLFDK